MQDIRHYSDNELCLLFDNTEFLYNEFQSAFSFDELSEESKERALSNLWDLNVDYEWWKYTYEDAEQIGCKITGFDIDRANYCNLEFIDYAEDVAKSIIDEHGETCETYKTAKQFLSDREKLVSKYSRAEDDWDFDYECDELNIEFQKSLSEDYRVILSNEYDYQTTEKSIIETIEANEYEFTEDGKLS